MLRSGSTRRSVWTFLLLLAAPGFAGSATIELISGTDIAADAFGSSDQPVLSADGRYVAFTSNAENLAPGQEDDNNARDVFLHDRLLGITTLVSHAAGSPTRAGSSGGYDYVDISADGRYVAFSGVGANLVPGAVDDNGFADVFLWDRVTGTTTLVSHAAGSPGTAADAPSFGVRISADGNFLAFTSRAGNLVPGQAEPAPIIQTTDVFLWSRATGTTTLVSRRNGTTATAADQPSVVADLSANGGVVVFTTFARDLLPGITDFNEAADVYAYERSSDALSLVSRAANAPQSAAGALHSFVAVSADGRYVTFTSEAGNLVPGQVDDSSSLDAFLHDRTTGETRLASHRSASPLRAGGISDASGISMSADGRYVGFSSAATDLIPGQVDTNQNVDVFVYDRVTGLIVLASHSHGSVTTAASLGASSLPSPSSAPSFSADGRFLVFHSRAMDLVPGQTDVPGTIDVFLYDQDSRTATLMSRTRASASTAGNEQSFSPVLSADGSVAAFLSRATDLGEGQNDPYGFQDLFLYHRPSGEITHASRRDPSLTPPLTSLFESILGGLSADGRSVVFERSLDVFLRDTVADTTTLISPPPFLPDTRAFSRDSVLSADGRFAAFIATQLGVNGPAEGLYLYDRAAGTHILVNHAPGSLTEIDGFPVSFALSADARYVAYQCAGCGLVPGHATNGLFEEIFLYDRLSGVNILVSRATDTSQPAFPANGESYSPAISADGRYVAFRSFASNLFPGQVDNSHTEDLFVFDRVTGATSLVTYVPGSPNTAAGLSTNPSTTPVGLSADGRFIVFESLLPNLVPGQVDANAGFDIFLHDLVARTTVLVSHAASSLLTTGNRPSEASGPEPSVSMSADGRFVAYESPATDLVAGAEDTNGAPDVFLYDRLTGSSSLVSHAGGAPLKAANRESELPRISADGSHVAFLSAAVDLIPGQTAPPPVSGSRDLYVRDRSAGTTVFIARAWKRGRPFNPFPSDGQPVSIAPQLSANGRRIAFTSDVALAPGDYNGTWDVYLWDQDGTVEPEEPGGPIPVPPCRLLDTRRRAERPILTSNVRRTVAAHGRCGVPATAKEVVVKVTVFNPSGKGNLRFYPGAVTLPPSAILRFERGTSRTETFTLPLGTNGTLTILPFVAGKGTVHVAVEVTAYEN